MKSLIFFACSVFIFFNCFNLNLSAQEPKATQEEDYLELIISQALDKAEKTKQVPSVIDEEKDVLAYVEIPLRPKIIIDVLELRDMDILDVLKLISRKSGLNIVASKNVKGKVAIFLKEVDVWDALKIILETNELAFEQEGNIIKVMTDREYELTYGKKFSDKTETKIISLKYANAIDLISSLTQMKSIIGKVIADEKSNTAVLIDTTDRLIKMQNFIKEIDVPIVTKIFNLNYAKADDLEKKISEVLTKNVGKLKVDIRSNKMFATDTPTKMAEIERIVSAFDEKHREVLIEAKIVKIVLSDQYRMGVDWEGIIAKYGDLTVQNSFSVLTTTDKKGKISIGTLAEDKYTALVEALEEVGTTNTLSSPRITALNNEEAKILVGSTEPYVTTTTTTPASGPTTTAEAVNFIDVGVKLYVTPTINKDNFITMKIKPEVSSVTSYLTTSQNNKIPIVETSQAETSVMVKDGVTIVIGGLIKDELIETVKKVPLLGDIPLVGLAFRSKDKLVRKSELVIFLTPHITYGDNSTNQALESAKISE
ncbi:MAG: secretin N-terminal domain-containing protein [Candidatus Omnitrophota bacterium]|nr:secretin N-terminal domain-containing protein [Candidatus Omnitrophota bacterium]